ncbi:unnamed protein product [Coffea canephora]|uniref:Uncharacterized protein n=1 Tax=Coffea canephora TaxID=49390 RepID=A0A068V5F0_COFCA|nr:unnamed protein product [Coffea canephora]
MAHRESSDVNFKDLSPKSKNVQSFSTLLLMVFFFSWILFDLSVMRLVNKLMRMLCPLTTVEF